MKLVLARESTVNERTFGKLSVDGVYECETLEDAVRFSGEKIFGHTAIPFGEYVVIINHSRRFNRLLPLLLSVPNFEGIRIHPGNSISDTEGCILVGTARVGDTVVNSRVAFNKLFDKMQDAIESGDSISIEITNG